MTLGELIKIKFMPPFKEDGNLYQDRYIVGYSLKEKDGKYLPFIKDRLSELENHYPTKGYSHNGWRRKIYMNSYSEEEVLFDTPEEAREVAWKNFEYNYFEDVERIYA